MYDKAEKVLALDDTMLMAISGAFSKAIEFVRFLRHSFKYYERSQLQPLSLDGKLNEIGRLMAGNLGGAMSGGLVIPVIAVYDQKQSAGRIFFYDAAGARFENLQYAAAGSGSVQIRGAFEYIVRTKGNFSEMPLEAALAEALHLLEIAADLDSATAGAGKVLPLARTVTSAGVTEISDDAIRAALGASTTTATSI
jgi:proteasome beta subunit